jgi:hypothetical protein
VLLLIGEQLERSGDVCGAVVSKRKNGDKISIWTADCKDEDSVMGVGWVERLVVCLNLASSHTCMQWIVEGYGRHQGQDELSGRGTDKDLCARLHGSTHGKSSVRPTKLPSPPNQATGPTHCSHCNRRAVLFPQRVTLLLPPLSSLVCLQLC